MLSPIVSSTSYPTVSVVVTRRMSHEDRIDLMRFLFTGPTKIVDDMGQEGILAADGWVEGDSEVSVPELVADLDDSFLGPDILEQGKEATAVEEAALAIQREGRTHREQEIEPTEEAGESEGGDGEDTEGSGDERAFPQAQGAPPLSVKSLTLYRQLGVGGFGQVYAASLKGSDKIHAVKIIPKTEENEDQVLREKDILLRLAGCHFFPQLEASWQSSLNYYLVTVCTFSLRQLIHSLFISGCCLFVSRYTLGTSGMKSTDSVALPSMSHISTSNKFSGPSIISTPITSFTETSNSRIFF